MPNGPLDPAEVLRAALSNPMWAIRGRAIQEYATLEQSLFRLFVFLTSTEPRIAGVVFFKQTSSQARNAIFDKLIRTKFGSEYALFWNSYLSHLRPIDTRRNEIVHWNTIITMALDEKGGQVNTPMLGSPNFWAYEENTPFIKTDDLMGFIIKCNIYARLCTMFYATVAELLDQERRQPWLDIFRQPIVYPLPADHPLCKTPPG
jgi:hypothetical protein